MTQKHLQVGDINAGIEQIRCVGMAVDVIISVGYISDFDRVI